jgi:hypothetical protein
MIVFFFLGLITSMFTLLSIYPLFQDESIGLGILFGFISLLAFHFFCYTSPSGRPRKTGHTIVKTVYLQSTVYLFEILGLCLYIEVFSRWRELPFLLPIFQTIFILLRVPNGLGGGSLHLYGISSYVHTFLPNAGNVGIVYLLVLTFGAASLWFISKDRKKSRWFLGFTAASLPIYLIIRTTAIIGLFCSQNVGERSNWYYLTFFWHPIYGFISFIPWLLLVVALFGKEKLVTDDFSTVFHIHSFQKHSLAAISLGLTVFWLILFLFWVPSGVQKQGRILFEEYYSQWTKSTKAFDEHWYGPLSTYNYYTFRTYLNSFYPVTINEEPLENVNLAKYDILLLKIPTRPYSQTVINKIVHYVNNGGSLWVIGDHTNVFGSSTYLNPILKHFGMRLRYDAIFHNVSGSFNPVNQNSWIKHPILQNVPAFLFATPCSIQVDNLFMKIVIPGETTKTYPVNYAKGDFFPDTKPDLNIFFGSNILLAAGDFGRGRIAVLADSTPFSNFSIYLPGKTEMAMGIIGWLNHVRAPWPIKPVILILMVGSFMSFLHFSKRINHTERYFFWFMTAVIFSVFVALFSIRYYNQKSFVMPKGRIPLIKAGFLEQYSTIYLPYTAWKNGMPDNYNTFYIWGQREGICARYYFDINKALQESKTIFMILPKKKFSGVDLKKLDSFLKKGGKIFVLDYGAKGSSANKLLNRYGLCLEYHKSGKGKIFEPGNQDFWENTLPLGTIKGSGETLLFWKQGNQKPQTIFCKRIVGKGAIFVFGGVLNFSNSEFGSDKVIPVGNKMKINQLILRIYQMSR